MRRMRKPGGGWVGSPRWTKPYLQHGPSGAGLFSQKKKNPWIIMIRNSEFPLFLAYLMFVQVRVKVGDFPKLLRRQLC